MLTGQKYIKTSIQKRSLNFDFSNMFMKKDASIPLETTEIFDLYSRQFSINSGEVHLHPSILTGSDSEKRIKIVKIYLYVSQLLNNEYTSITKLAHVCHNQRLGIKKGSDLKRSLFIPERRNLFKESTKGISLTEQGKIDAKYLMNELNNEIIRPMPKRAKDVIKIFREKCWENDLVTIHALSKECEKYGYRFSTSDVKRSVCSSRTRNYFILDHKKQGVNTKRDGSTLILSPFIKKILKEEKFKSIYE